MIAKDFKYLMDMLDTIVDVDIKDKKESIKYLVDEIILSCFTSFRSSFLQEFNWKWFYEIRVMVDVNIQNKEESIKKLTYNC